MSEHSTHTTELPAAKRLERSREDRMVAGVAGGLAKYFDVHPAFYRVGFVVLTLLGGAGILIYAAAALVMPDEGKEDSVATAALKQRRERPWPLIGLALVAVALVSLLSRATLWPHGDAWFLLLVAGAAILWVTRRSDRKQPEAAGDPAALAVEDSRRIRRVFKGFAIAFGTLVALILVATAVFAASFHVHVGSGVGDRNYVVAGAGDLDRNYKLGIGDMTLDLRNVTFPRSTTDVNARVDVGSLRVIVPDDVALRVHADAQAGQVNLLGNSVDGHNVDDSVTQTGGRVLDLDAHVGAGVVTVERAVR
jgi:phage shock protein PspC (stress-responsive transcriptional regulator)